jgi:hypothetical protein
LLGNASLDPKKCGNGYKLLTCYGALLDAQGDALIAGLNASFPGFGDDYSLNLLGQQRRIPRGFLETSQQYAQRLWFWRQANRRKGSAWVLMEQLQALLQGYPVVVRIICGDGTSTSPATRYTLAAGGYLYNGDYLSGAPVGTASIDQTPSNWDWGPQPSGSAFDAKSRFWVLLFGHPWTRDGLWTDAGVWTDYNTTDNTATGTVLDPYQASSPTPDPIPTYGSTCSFSTAQAILSIVRNWSPPNADPQQVILCFDDAPAAELPVEVGDPLDTTAFDSINPTGNWQLPAERDPSYVYWTV